MNDISVSELSELLKKSADNIELLDIREKNEWDLVKVRGAKLYPLSSLQFRIHEIDFSKPVFLLCRSGGRSSMVCDTLNQIGKPVKNVRGGILEFIKKYPEHLIVREGADLTKY